MRSTPEQPELFAIDPDTTLFPYWRRSMLHWPKEAFMFRHYHNTTGWSMARQGLMFPRMLFRHGQITRAEYRRWWRFDRRIKRIDTAHRNRKPTCPQN
jgi:hypothetical protein